MSWLVRRTIASFRKRREALRDVFEWTRRSSTATSFTSLKVAIIGAAGKTGSTLALCLKQSPIIDELAVYDNSTTWGLIMELSHMDSRCKTFCYEDDGETDGVSQKRRLERTLRGAKVVAICLEREYLYEEAACVKILTPSLIACCPKAFVALVSRSVNSLLPMMFEIYKAAGFYDHSRLFGVTNLFSTRANNFAARTLALDPEFVSVPVIGGGTATTCIPIFSKSQPCADFTPEEFSKMMQAMKGADAEVADAYGPVRTSQAESSSHCAGFAAARFCISLCKALRSQSEVLECAYVRCCLMPELKYMTVPLELGPCGIQRYLGLPKLSNRECAALYAALPEIQKAIALGESLALHGRRSTEACPVLSRCTSVQLYE